MILSKFVSFLPFLRRMLRDMWGYDPPFCFFNCMFSLHLIHKNIFGEQNCHWKKNSPTITLLLSFVLHMMVPLQCCTVSWSWIQEVSRLYETQSWDIHTRFAGQSVTMQTIVLSRFDIGLPCTKVSKFNYALYGILFVIATVTENQQLWTLLSCITLLLPYHSNQPMVWWFLFDPITLKTFDSNYDIFPDYLPELRLKLRTISHHNWDTKVKMYTIWNIMHINIEVLQYYDSR